MKSFFSKRWVLIALAVIVLGVPGTLLLARNPATNSSVDVRVKRGDFKVLVTTSGELRALRDIKISGPTNMQQAQIFSQIKIQTLIPEGTVVKEGDTVAVLDRSAVATKLSDVSLALQKAQAEYETAELDSALNLSKAREDIKTMELGLEEKRIAKDQSKFEAPSVQRQADIDLEKAQRELDQAKSDYKTKTEQAQAKMREVDADLQRQKNLLAMVQDVLKDFTITAPAPGMVIYMKEWNGKKRTAGSSISSWDPVVATLPDLSGMQSVTYVNEIDVRKVAVGQPVTITLDADQSKKLHGTVTSVANVGDQRPNADAKVFEVVATLDKPDTALRPGMTTGNAIETASIRNVLFIPLEAMTSEAGTPYVFKKSGSRIVKQEIETGAMNDDEVVVARGLAEGDDVLLAAPPDEEKIPAEHLPGTRQTPRTPAGGDTAISKPVVPDRPPKHADSTMKGPAAATVPAQHKD